MRHFEINEKRVIITGEPNIDLETALSCPPFTQWVANLDREIDVRAIHMQSMDLFGRKVGFLKFKAEAYGPDGNPLPGIVFMRGAVVVVFVVLVYKDIEFTIRTEQARIAVGRLKQPEGVAGMVDPGERPIDAAVRELEEESGIRATADELVCLNDEMFLPLTHHLQEQQIKPRGVFVSPGASDEEVWYFLYRTQVDFHPSQTYDGKQTGTGPEERIKLSVWSLEEIWRHSPTNHTLALLFLYGKWKQRNNL